MTKQEKIQDAYGEYWDKFKGYVDENGWLNCKEKHRGLIPYFDVCEIKFSKVKQRPISLEGIDNNNGWVKIYIESDLPKKDLECYVTNAIGRIQFGEFEKETESFFVNNDRIFPTHYQKIIKPNYPIY